MLFRSELLTKVAMTKVVHTSKSLNNVCGTFIIAAFLGWKTSNVGTFGLRVIACLLQIEQMLAPVKDLHHNFHGTGYTTITNKKCIASKMLYNDFMGCKFESAFSGLDEWWRHLCSFLHQRVSICLTLELRKIYF